MSLSKLTNLLFVLALFTLSCRESEHGSPPGSAPAPPGPPGNGTTPPSASSNPDHDSYTPAIKYPVTSYQVAIDSISIIPPINDESRAKAKSTSDVATAVSAAFASMPDSSSPQNSSPSSPSVRAATSESLSTPLSTYAQSTRKISDLQFASGHGSHFYTGFPLSVRFGLNIEGDASKMLVSFGLVEAPPLNFPKERYKELRSCAIGSASAVHDGSVHGSGSELFQADLKIPESCLGDTGSARMIITMVFNPDGAVQSGDSNAPIFVALDKETTSANGLCLRFDKNSTACQNEILIEKSPGVNIKMTDFTSDSSLVVLPYKDPAALYKTNHTLPSPLATTSGSLVLEGAAAEDLAHYKAQISYSICAGDGGSDTLTAPCDGPGWQPLSALLSPGQTELDKLKTTQDLTGFKNEESLNFSALVHALGSSYKALSTADEGVWGNETFFRIKACATIFKNDQTVTEVNLDSQATNGDATADNCMIFPVFKSEETEPTNTHVCSAKDSTLDSDGECDTSYEDTSLKVVNPVADYQKSWGGAWGDQNKLRVSFDAGPHLVMSANKISARIGSGIRTQGYLKTDLFAADLEMFLDLTGADQHYLEPSIKAFGVKIYGSRMLMAADYEYSLPLEKWFGDNGHNKTVDKSVTATIEKSANLLDAPQIVNKGDIHNKPSALFVKELCAGASVPVYIITVSIDVCGELGAYLGMGAYARVRAPYPEEKATYPGGKRVAAVGLYFVPALAASGRGQVSIGIIIARIGVGGEMRIVELALPVTLSAKAGNYQLIVRRADGARRTVMALKANANFDTSLDLAWLGGRLYVFAEYWGFSWCKAWIFPYPCHFGWKTVDKDIVSFKGEETRFTLIHADFFDKTWEPFLAADAKGCSSVLEKGEDLKQGQRLCSTDGNYTLSYQNDGNLVLYDKNQRALWASFTEVRGAVRATMQADGNFVIYDIKNQPLWASGTYSNSGERVMLMNDGSFQIVNANSNMIWTSKGALGSITL
ncbi:MAG: hypothetical protein H7249_19730 [Chitinophagaceae bacterium]|nr:hypothetical protein [Oligoflexus sp.]